MNSKIKNLILKIEKIECPLFIMTDYLLNKYGSKSKYIEYLINIKLKHLHNVLNYMK